MFSGAVKLGDLNDYIAPSQACVVALQGGKLAPGQDDTAVPPPPPPPADDDDDGGLVLQRRRPPRATTARPAPAPPPKNVGFQQTYTEPPREGAPPGKEGAVRVTLHDCLACAGCVTSAETVLLQQQSTEELLQRLRAGDAAGPVVVVSISPQSRASLAALHGLPSAADAHLRLATFFKRVLGARAVLDLGVAREVALLEAAEEFCARFAAAAAGLGGLADAAAALRKAGAIRAAERAEVALAEYREAFAASSAGPLPVLASACPGWVCYAEKTPPAAAGGGGGGAPALPHLSAARSPQGVMGRLVKGGFWGGGGERKAEGGGTYHVTVMPCYDKKLEAARDELAVAAAPAAGAAGAGSAADKATAPAPLLEPEVDCCLSTSEVQALLEAHGCGDLSSVEPAAELDALDGRALPAAAFFLPSCSSSSQQQRPDAPSANGSSALLAVDQPPLHDPSWGAPGSLPGSGGWAAFILRYAARRLFGIDNLPHLSPRRLRNTDMHELALEMRHALEAEGLVAGAGDAASSADSPSQPPPPPLLRFAAAYGFRNIQAVVRRLPQPSATAAAAPSYYDFVEVMACPGGCLNGGGQMAAAKAVAAAGVASGAGRSSAAAATLDQLESLFAGAPAPEAMDVDHGPTQPPASWEPGRSAAVQRVYRELAAAGDGAEAAAAAAAAPGSAAARRAFHTTFRRREKTLASAVGDW